MMDIGRQFRGFRRTAIKVSLLMWKLRSLLMVSLTFVQKTLKSSSSKMSLSLMALTFLRLMALESVKTTFIGQISPSILLSAFSPSILTLPPRALPPMSLSFPLSLESSFFSLLRSLLRQSSHPKSGPSSVPSPTVARLTRTLETWTVDPMIDLLLQILDGPNQLDLRMLSSPSSLHPITSAPAPLISFCWPLLNLLYWYLPFRRISEAQSFISFSCWATPWSGYSCSLQKAL